MKTCLNGPMRIRKIGLLFLCLGVGLTTFVLLDFWSDHNAPLYLQLQQQWEEDVHNLEASPKLPKAWFDVKELEITGGTPETKSWLRRIHVPLKTKKDGHYKLEVLVVAWEEEGKQGALVQYNLTDLKTQNMIWELGRTFILRQLRDPNPLKAFLDEVR